MLSKDDDDNENSRARQFLFTYFKPSDKNSIEQYEDDFITQFQLIHDEIEEATQNLCKTYEDILDVYTRVSPHKCVWCQKDEACFAAEVCGHVLFCEKCFDKFKTKTEDIKKEDKDKENDKRRKIICPVCKKCYEKDIYLMDSDFKVCGFIGLKKEDRSSMLEQKSDK